MVLAHQVALPDLLAVVGGEAMHDQVGREHVDLAIIDRRRGARAIAAAGRIAAAVTFAPRDVGGPLLFAGGRVEAQADFARLAIEIANDLA